MRNHWLLCAVAASLAGACRTDTAPGRQGASTNLLSLSPDSLRCAQTDTAGRCALYQVSVIDLIARPAEFHGKRVRIIGYARFEFEGNALYLSREDWRRGIDRNGLWLEPPAGRPDSLNDRFLLVEATFVATDGGHLGLWSGSLKGVDRLEAWGDAPPGPPTGFTNLSSPHSVRRAP